MNVCFFGCSGRSGGHFFQGFTAGFVAPTIGGLGGEEGFGGGAAPLGGGCFFWGGAAPLVGADLIVRGSGIVAASLSTES